MRTLIAALALVCLLPLAGHAAIVDIHVTSAANSGPNTLRQAIIDGNALVATNDVPRILIDLDNASPILLTSPLPAVTATYLQIRGTGSHRARIDGGGAHRILTTNSSVLLLLLKNVALINGYSTQGAGCLQMSTPTSSGFATLENVWFRNCRQSGTGAGNNGGAVNTSHNLTITDSLFSFNGVVSNGSNQGGAISLFGDDRDLTIRGSRFESNSSVSNGPVNSAAAYGGAIFVLRGKSVTIEDSVFADNHTDTPNDNGPGIRLGGALHVRLSGKLSLVRTALFGNDAGTGGAIHHTGSSIGNTSVELRNVSAAHNRATQGNGGVLVSAGPLTLHNNTFWRNSATGAGDNLASVASTASIVAAHNNLFAAGVGVGDSCSGFTTVSSGYNIVPAIECGLGTGSSDIITSDLHIRGVYTGPWGDFTVQLYSSSPAFDAGNPLAPSDTIAGRCATTDFLGQPRPVDASGTGATPRCDIGALEAQSEPSLFIDDFEGRWLRP